MNNNKDFEKNAKIFKALSDPNRLKIVQILSCKEKCGCEILSEFNFTQPTLSHHMKVLIDSGIVCVRKEGIWNHYKLNCTYVKEFLTFANDIFHK